MRLVAAILLLSFVSFSLIACDTTPTQPDPPKKVEQPAPKKAEPKQPAPKQTDQAVAQFKRAQTIAQYMTISAHVGALNKCRAANVYNSETLEDTYYRLRGVMLSIAETGDEGEALSNIAYAAYVRAFQEGTAFTITVPTENNPDARFDVETEVIDTVEKCKKVEKWLDKLRAKGGILDVKPNRDGLGIERKA